MKLKKLSYRDLSQYIRGLSILIKKDKVIHENEKKLILEFGLALGFEDKFYTQSVEEFLKKKNIDILPPKFSSQEIAKLFIYDAIKMAFIDDFFHKKELEWIYDIADENKIPREFVIKTIKEYWENYPSKKIDFKLE